MALAGGGEDGEPSKLLGEGELGVIGRALQDDRSRCGVLERTGRYWKLLWKRGTGKRGRWEGLGSTEGDSGTWGALGGGTGGAEGYWEAVLVGLGVLVGLRSTGRRYWWHWEY